MANAKLDVEIAGFVSNINSAKGVLKGLNAEMKAADAAFKATGNAEQQMAAKTKVLNSQIQMQKGIADQAAQALKAMTDAGVDPMDAAYQRLYATMQNATAGMNNAQAELNGLSGSAQGAAASADQLTTSVQSIGKKISLDQVITGIDRITHGLENAAKKALQFGEDLWNTIMDSARRADDSATMAEMYGIPLERFLQMQRLVGSGMDTTVDAMLSSMDKLNKGIGNETKSTIEALQSLGIEYKHLAGDEGVGQYVANDPSEVFWEAGQALLAMGDAFDKEAAAQALFGKSWKELKPLFDTYKSLEEYNKALDEMTVTDEETVRDLAALNDAVSNLEASWTTLKDQVLGSLAPALTKGANAISGLLDNLTKYLQTDDGQKLLENLGTAVSGLFDDLGKIDPEQVVSGFTGVITSVTGGIQWLVDNAETVKGILGTIVGAWALSNVAVAGLEITKLIQGLTGLAGAGAAEGAAAAGAAAGSAWASAFAGAALVAAPWLMAYIASQAVPDENKLGNEKRVESAKATEDELRNLREYIRLQNELAKMGDLYGTDAFDEGKYNSLADAAEQLGKKVVGDSDLWKKYWDYVVANDLKPGELPTDIIDKMLSGFDDEEAKQRINKKLRELAGGDKANEATELELPIGLKVANDAGDGIRSQVGEVDIPVFLVVSGISGGGNLHFVRGLGGDLLHHNANGIPSVPYDGYLSELHKGERVVPAREVQSRSYNSNLYVESMYMNNGTDAAGLASAMAAAQRRTMSGYGS